MTTSHVDLASEEFQQDRVSKVLSTGSYHFKTVCGALARITFLTGQDWHSTSTIHKQYPVILSKETKPLSYRRVSELLTELENTGLVVSQTSSKGKHGCGTQYKLVVSPDMVGKAVAEEWWNDIVQQKRNHDATEQLMKSLSSGSKKQPDPFENMAKSDWDKFVGL